MKGKCMYNARIILKDRIISGYLLIRNGKIVGVDEGEFKVDRFGEYEKIDIEGKYILPGLIDIKNTSFKDEYKPKYGEYVPFNVAFGAIEKKLITLGITTVYHSFSLRDNEYYGNSELTIELIRMLNRMKYKRFIINHRMNLIYDLKDTESFEKVIDIIDSKEIDFLTLKDIVWESDENINMSFSSKHNRELELINKQELQKHITHVINHCKRKGINIGADDLASIREFKNLLSLGINLIGELEDFDMAAYCISRGIYVYKQANEFLLKDFYINRIKPFEEFLNETANIIISGNTYSSLLPSVFKIGNIIGNIPKAVSMATLNSAKAAGVDEYCGSIEEGKMADIIVVEIYDELPVVREVFIRGKRVFYCDFFE